MKVEIYSDIACPWCYVGKVRLERALETHPSGSGFETRFRSFQLDPAAPIEAAPLLDYLEQRFGPELAGKTRHVAEHAHAEGIEMDFESALAVNTLEAHRLLLHAESDYGMTAQRAVVDGLFRGHFALGLDLGDRETLVEIGAAAGMDRDRTRRYLGSDAGRKDVAAEIERARQLGITAVPTFVFDGRIAVQGAHSVESLLRVLDRLAEEIPPPQTGSGSDVRDID